AVACVLPGVAVGPTLALGVADALGRARLRRRRRRSAVAPSAGLYRHDPFASPLSRRMQRFALARRALAWSPNGSGAAGVPVVAAERDGREVAVDLAALPLALVGPGAPGAARALVATLVATTEPGAARAVVAGHLFPPGPSFPGLHRAESLERALSDLDAEVERRRAAVPPAPGGNGTGNGAAPPDVGPGDAPVVVLVTSAPPPGLAQRLAGLLERGRPVGVTALVVGDALPGAATVAVGTGGLLRSVDPADRAGELDGSRLYTLDAGPAAEVLEVLAAARTDDAGPDVPPASTDERFPVLAAADPAPITVRVLGPYRIEVDGKEIRSGLRAKARELLAFYLLHPEGTTLDVATEALWPEADPGRGSEWFWTALGNLRSLLRTATGTKALKVIERDGDRYRIEPVFDVDLWRFQAALPPAGAATGDADWAAALQTAADLYGGELLAGVDWAWAEVPRDDLRRRAVDVLVSLAATRLVAGDARSALDTLSRAVEVDPVAEQLYRRIMRLHANQSRPDEVEATFSLLRSRLGELDLEPTPESARLVAELCR
ncbi:MAG: BTAD domain-containing putative transcriptional regulator, partial [Acidimicrobiales bacterium]